MKNAVLMILLVLPLLVVQLRADTDKSNDVVHIGKSISVAPNETVGDAVCVGCSIRMNGRATGDLVAVGGGIQVEGNVQGDVVAVAGHLRLGSNAFVHGDAVAVGGTLQRDPGSRVNGTVTNPRTPMMAGVGGMAMLLLVPFLGALAAGIVLSILCWLILGQARIETIVATLRAQTALALLAGLGVIVGFVVLVIALHWTGPASPFIIGVLCLLLFLLAVVGYTGVSAWIGEGVTSSNGRLAAVVVGAIIVGILQTIPVVGLVAIVVFALFALGGAALSGFGTQTDWLAQRFSQPHAGGR